MKLCVWNIDGMSIIYAVGRTVEEARAEARTAPVFLYGSRPEGNFKFVECVEREPDRIYECPAAEGYRYEE